MLLILKDMFVFCGHGGVSGEVSVYLIDLLWALLGSDFVGFFEGVSTKDVDNWIGSHIDPNFGHLLLLRGVSNDRGRSHNILRVGIFAKIEHLFARGTWGVLGWLGELVNSLTNGELLGVGESLSVSSGRFAFALSCEKIGWGPASLHRWDLGLTESESGAAGVMFESFDSDILFTVFDNFVWKLQAFILIFKQFLYNIAFVFWNIVMAFWEFLNSHNRLPTLNIMIFCGPKWLEFFLKCLLEIIYFFVLNTCDVSLRWLAG